MFCQHCGAKRLDVRGPCQACGRQSSELLGEMLIAPDELAQEESCSNCGTPLAGDEVFCGDCGAPVHPAEPLGLPPPPPGAAPPPLSLPPAAATRTPLLVGLLCFAASLVSGAAAIWLASGR
jgi:hypothetical protein